MNKRASHIQGHSDLVMFFRQTEERLAAIERKLYGNGESLEAQIVRLATKIDALEHKQTEGIQEAIAQTVKEIMKHQKNSSIIGYVMVIIAVLGLILAVISNMIKV